MTPSIRPIGDSAALIKWEGADDEVICRAVRRITGALNQDAEANSERGFHSVVAAFQSVTVHFCLSRLSFSDAVRTIEKVLLDVETVPEFSPRRIEIPVCFDETFAADLAEVAEAHDLSPAELIHRFCGAEYFVRMIGFSPGFPYLSGLPQELATPRRSSPRLKVPQGSVAIGGSQAGVYSQDTPGGWNIIGRTPVRLFRAELSQPCLLTTGDQVRFLPIHADQFLKWQDEQ